MKNQRQHHHQFPQPLVRLSGLEGGAYGEIYLKALSRHRVELDLGNEFVTFDREQVREVKDALCRFLEMEERYEEQRAERKEEKEIGEAVEAIAHEIAEEIHPRPSRRRRQP